jgi:hypothetical protein
VTATCPASRESVEQVGRGEVGCPLCGKPADVHPSEKPVEPMTMLRFTACPPDGPDFEYAQRMTHDEVVAGVAEVGGRATGPVRWRTYAPESAEAMLRESGTWDLSPNAPGLIEFLREHPGTVLMIASLDYIGDGTVRAL